MSVINVLIKTALDNLQLQNPVLFSYINRVDFENLLQSSLENVISKEITLQSDKPDFEDILFAFVQELQTDKAWKDIVHTGTGQTLSRNISAGVSFLHFAIVRAVQNSFLLPGASRETVYQGMNFLGVNIRRKIPKRIQVRLTIPDHDVPFVIPAFTQIVISGERFFNRENITYTVFELFKDVTLYQGIVYTQEGKASGDPFETIEIGYENFSISDEDVYVTVNGVPWQRDAKLRPWMAKKNQQIFFTRTLETGNVSIMFGNDIYAKKLFSEDLLKITWVETKGLDAELINAETNFIINNLALSVQGLTLSSSFGGDDELDLNVYANLGPHIMASSEAGIRRPDFTTLALKYPNIKDAKFLGQAEYAPNLRTYQNVVMATILTGSSPNTMNQQEWGEFTEYLNRESVFALRFHRNDPVIIPIIVAAKVNCTIRANLTEIESVLISKTQEFTEPRQGILGYSVYASDIISILEGNFKHSTTDYSRLIEFVSDFTFMYPSDVDTISLGFDGINLGITPDGNAVLASSTNYVKIVSVDLNIVYTPRQTYQGRNDLVIS